MLKYKNKPTVVEAALWDGMTNGDAKAFAKEHGTPVWTTGTRKGKFGLIIPTLEGDAVAPKGTYVVKGTRGEFWPVRGDIFKEKYEKVEKDKND